MFGELKASPILEAALARGGQMSELFLEESSGLLVVMDDGVVEKVISGMDRGACLRLIYDHRTAFAYSNELGNKALMPLAQNLAAMAKGTPPELTSSQPQQPGLINEVVKHPQDTTTKVKVDLVRAAEAAARKVDPRVRQVRVNYLDRVQQVGIINSQGVEAEDRRVQVILVIHCIAEDKGVVQTGYEVTGGSCGLEIFDQESPEEAARAAASRAVMMLEARPAPGGAMPVVLHSSSGGTMIHEAVGHGLEGDIVNENMSVYAGKVGQKVASPLITVVDDGTMAAKRGSFGFDDEGEPSRRNVLIQDGKLTGYMHDRLSALKMGAKPTGNGRRESYRHRPVPRMTNTIIVPGQEDPDSIISRTPHGLLVKKMGGGQVNTVNGDFVFEVQEGYLIQDGRIGEPVRGATLTGNGPQVLRQIDLVGTDLGFGLGTCGKNGQGAPVGDAQPTLRIPSIVVGGLHQ
jgi:TldD protein